MIIFCNYLTGPSGVNLTTSEPRWPRPVPVYRCPGHYPLSVRPSQTPPAKNTGGADVVAPSFAFFWYLTIVRRQGKNSAESRISLLLKSIVNPTAEKSRKIEKWEPPNPCLNWVRSSTWDCPQEPPNPCLNWVRSSTGNCTRETPNPCLNWVRSLNRRINKSTLIVIF